MKKIIHVNQHNIKHNTKTGDNKPVLTCKTYKRNTYGHNIDILGDNGKVVASIIYRPDKPLSCGAKCWIETTNEIIIH